MAAAGAGTRAAWGAWREWLLCLSLPLAVAVLMAASGAARFVDNAVFRQFSQDQAVAMSPRIGFVDLDYPAEMNDDGDLRDYRLRLAALLGALSRSERVARVIVIDVWFSASPVAEAPLAQAVRALQDRGARVLAAVNVLGRHGEPSADYRRAHNARLYGQVFDGFGHTLLEHRRGLLAYRPAIELPVAGAGAVEIVPALPMLAVDGAGRVGDPHVFPFRDGVQDWQRVRVGAADDPAAALSGPVLQHATHLVIGSFGADADNVLGLPGPMLLGYAISDRLDGAFSAVPLNDARATLLITVLACLAAALVFFAGFRRIRRQHAPAAWSRRAVLPLGGGFVLAALVVGLVFLVVLGSQRVAPVALPLATALALSASLWVFVRQQQADAAVLAAMEQAGAETAVEFDVFISYAHDPDENRDWVRERVFKPISGLRHADGRAFRVFFDQRSIVPGRQWKREIELALLGSRCFVPVYSARYFERAYCREEIELADQLRIEGRLSFVPVAREGAAIPERYMRKVQYLRDSEADFDARLLELVARRAHAVEV